MKVIKRILKWIGYLIGLMVLLVIAQMGWGMYREPIAKKEAEDFCAKIKVGQSIDGIQERAIEIGAVKQYAKWRVDEDGSKEMLVIFIGTPPFSRHICAIKATDVVVTAAYQHLD
jgi:hypothetical protein